MSNSKLEALQAELETERKHQQRREQLEAQIKAEQQAADTRVQVELEISKDPQAKAWRESLGADIRAWHSDLLKAELTALETVESLEVRRMALYEQGVKAGLHVKHFFETRGVKMSYGDEFQYAPEVKAAQSIAPEAIRVSPSVREHLRDRHASINSWVNFRNPQS